MAGCSEVPLAEVGLGLGLCVEEHGLLSKH